MSADGQAKKNPAVNLCGSRASSSSSTSLDGHRKRRRKPDAITSLRGIVSMALLLVAKQCIEPTTSAHALVSRTLTRTHLGRRSSLGATTSPLDKLTVRELRERVKEIGTERGTLSKLKRKQDLVDFLQDQQDQDQQQQQQQGHQRGQSGSLSAPQRSSPSRLLMPPLSDDDIPLVENSSSDNSGTTSSITSANTTTATPTTASEASEPSKLLASSKASPKQAAFERVYQRYPALRQTNTLGSSSPSTQSLYNDPEVGASDPRQWQHPIYRRSQQNVTSSDMDVVFVGTASCAPGVTRGVSCTALRLNWRRPTEVWNPRTGQVEQACNFVGGTWLFDVGECTQLQIQRTANVRPGKITKIFLTHAHGDHTFGLPGLLCLMGEAYNRDGTTPPVDIYGPEGLRMWLRVAIRYSVSRIVPPYRVHELMEVPMAPEWEFAPRQGRFFYSRRGPARSQDWGTQGLAGQDPTSWITQSKHMPLEASPLYGEIEGGRDIYPQYNHPLSSDGAPVYEVEDEQDVKVYAAPMSHGIPCVGYAVHELSRPGRLRNEVVDPIVQRNLAALRDAGYRVPLKAKAVIKNLPEGSSFTFPDGTVLTQEEAVEPQREGRCVVICGDTCDSRAMTELAQNADLVVHESTNAYLPGLDSRDMDARSVTRDAILHGHSTPLIAARFAKQVKAQRLVLNHFSSRYKGDTSVESLSIMQRIEEQAVRQVPGWNETHVAAAWDLMLLPVPPR